MPKEGMNEPQKPARSMSMQDFKQDLEMMASPIAQMIDDEEAFIKEVKEEGKTKYFKVFNKKKQPIYFIDIENEDPAEILGLIEKRKKKST